MKPSARLFDDLTRMATGAVGAFSGVRQQIRQEIRTQMNRFLSEMDLVPREEFDIVEAMAREAILHAQRVDARLAELESRLDPNAKVSTRDPKQAAKSLKKAVAKKKTAKKISGKKA